MPTCLTLRLPLFLILAGPLALLTGCGDDGGSSSTCTVGAAEGCEAGLVCEEVAGGDPACFAPVHIAGRVFDAMTDAGIAEARVVSLDANGGARSGVVFSEADGSYVLPISVARDADGNPIAESVRLRVSADGYQTFPTPPRTALPVDLALATDDGTGTLVVQNTATDVALLTVPGASGLASIEGRVDHVDAGGVLVVAEQGGTAVSTSVTDADGNFLLYNVPDGETLVSGYRANLNVESATVTVAGAPVTDVVLAASTDGLTTVTGRVNIVETDGETSVILVVESTFDEVFIRGEAPAGLRVGNVNGNFEIPGVPPGRYAVLAAFENDGLVRDPDENIAGTDIVRIEVPEGGGTFAIDTEFKVTDALDVVSPGANGIEVVRDANPTFVFEQDSAEDGYHVTVFNAYGEEVHRDTMVPEGRGSADIEYTWTPDTPLEAGMVYQFRAVSFSSTPTMRFISATEDLKGVFEYQP